MPEVYDFIREHEMMKVKYMNDVYFHNAMDTLARCDELNLEHTVTIIYDLCDIINDLNKDIIAFKLGFTNRR